MNPKISRDLNIVIPVESPLLGTIYVHSVPIGRELFDLYYEVLGEVYSKIANKRLWAAAPRTAMPMLRDAAMSTPRPALPGQRPTPWWEGPDGIENGLLNEIRRLTNVVLPNPPHGWTTLPFVNAASDGTLDEEDSADVLSMLCFFTCLSASLDRRTLIASIVDFLSAQTTSLNSTEFANSLKTLTATGSSGGTVST